MEIFTSTETIMIFCIKPGKSQNIVAVILLGIRKDTGFRLPTRKRRLYGIYNVCFLILMITCSCKLVSFFFQSLNHPLKEYIQGRLFNSTLRIIFLKIFRSSLQSHPVWVILHDFSKVLKSIIVACNC